MKITGHINNPSSSLQPLNGIATVYPSSSYLLSSNLCVKLTVPDLPVLHSFKVKQIHLKADHYTVNQAYSATTMLKLLKVDGNDLYFDTPYLNASYTYSYFTVEVIYEIEIQDILLLNYIASKTIPKIVNCGCKLVTPSASALDYPSYIQNMGAIDNLLLYTDCYGNSGTITLKPDQATYFLVTVVNTGSGADLYQLYTK